MKIQYFLIDHQELMRIQLLTHKLPGRNFKVNLVMFSIINLLSGDFNAIAFSPSEKPSRTHRLTDRELLDHHSLSHSVLLVIPSPQTVKRQML
jgi:hypothetical protein